MIDLFQYVVLIPLLPFLGFLILGLLGSKFSEKISSFVGSTLLLVSTILSYITAYNYFFVSGKEDGIFQTLVPFVFTWLNIAPGLQVTWGVLLDPVSVMMLVVITTVSLMVFIYSGGYMHGERGFTRYFSFLSLFTFSMLSLVLSANIVQLYMCWELVGVSSFLLIGYYYDKPSAVSASKKAFIVTRFADFFFLIGIILLSWFTKSLDIRQMIHILSDATAPATAEMRSVFIFGFPLLSVALTLVFLGGAGKSAMFPLHIWLPDAMEGPTPVSALIHAATMVVAGVFLVARLFPIYAISAPDVLTLIGYVGVISSFLAAIIACTQFDIKRVLAYSTISQIGYMIMSLGVGGYGNLELGFMASQFHLFTHAMFKALLFLCAGMVIHAIHRNDMREMGGLWKKLPVTHFAFLIGCLAIAGIPPFSGFFSKEDILSAAYERDKFIWALALLTAGITSFYMFRLYCMIFHNGASELIEHGHSHIGEHGSGGGEHSYSMKIPLIFLAAASVVAGFVPFSRFVTLTRLPLETHFHLSLAAAAVGVSVTGILISFVFYWRKSVLPEKITLFLGSFYETVYRKFYFDELYLFITRKIIFNGISRSISWFDRNVVDGGVNGSAEVTQLISEQTKEFQSGKTHSYLFYFSLASLGFVLLFIYLLN